jgi:phosphohistidine swiveling domain-containing protein
MDKDIEEYNKTDWVNVSKGNWSFLSCTDFVNCYTREVLIGNQNSFDHPLQICYQGISELWFLQSEIDYFGNRITKLFNTPKEIEDLSDNLKKEADNVLDFFRKNSPENFNSEIYQKYWDKIKSYYRYHLVVKYIGDYLSSNDLEKYKPILQNARLYAEPVFDESEKLVRKIITNISIKVGVEDKLVSCLTREELKDFFDKNIFPNRLELEKRYLKAILWSDKNGYGFFTGKDAEKIESFLYPSMPKEINGTPAFGGVVQGVVRIILNPSIYNVFNEGDIIVAGMTRPDYLSIIKKSSAVVTDAGGILSHAAIIARELKKPCIIGTKIATKVLKDGDLVEVDADNGVVKIIKTN